MRTTPALIALLVAALGFAACGNDDTDSPRTDPPTTGAPSLDLDGRTFLSTDITDDGAPKTLVAGTRIRLGFADGALSVSAGCNSGGGDYTINDGVLVVDAIAMTEMACDDDRMAQDDWMLAVLGDSPAVALDGDTLTLTTDTVTIELLDREVADPDVPLEGTTWTATTLIDGDTATSLPDGAEVTLTFADGKVSGSFGCNRGSGTATIAGSTVTFGPLMTTKMACDEARGSTEAHVLSVLDGEVELAIEASSLTLMHGDVGLGLVAPTE
jgi:heat shock protein HslJ